MRTSMLSLTALAVAVAGVGCVGPDAFTDPVTAWESVLTGADHVPAIPTTARGTATYALNAAGTGLVYTINITTLPATAVTRADIHQAAAGANTATVAIALCGSGTLPACTALAAPGVLSTGTVTVTAAQVTTLRAFGMYVNVKTTGFPLGEIRGQLRIVAP